MDNNEAEIKQHKYFNPFMLNVYAFISNWVNSLTLWQYAKWKCVSIMFYAVKWFW